MEESSFLSPAALVRRAGIHEGMRVADFAAGAGFVTRAAARAVGPYGAVWAVDLRRELLPHIKNTAAREGLRNVEVMHGDISHIGGTRLPAGVYDAVMLCNALFALECRGCAAAEAARVLKRGGRVVCADWAGSFGGLGPREDHLVSLPEARALFEASGFAFVDTVPAGAYHWGCILKRI